MGLHAQHFDELSKKTGGGLGGLGIFLYATQSFCDEQKAQQVAAVLPGAPVPRDRAQSKRSAGEYRGCISLRNQQQSNLAAWLKQNAPANASIDKRSANSASAR